MKYLSLIIYLFIGSLTFAQVGLEASYGFGNTKNEIGNITIEESSNVASIGLVYDLELSETLDLQPSISFGIGEKVEGKSNNAIGIGAAFQYYFNNRAAGFYAGPVLGYSYSLADINTNIRRKGNIGSGAALGLDISEKLTIQTSYTFALTNASKVDGIKVSSNTFGVSLQYFFR